MLPALVAAAVIASPPAVVEKGGVRIAVTIMSHIYSWEVTNLGTEPITGFEVEYTRCYQHHAPDGWAVEADGRLFTARMTQPEQLDRVTGASPAIAPGRSATFSARTSSGGNALGAVTARVTVDADDGPRTIEFDEVWGPVAKPRALIVLVAALLGGLAIAHTVILVRRGTSAAAGRP